MKPGGRYPFAFIPLVIAAVALVTACTEPSSTPDPRLDTLEQRINALENEVGLLEDALTYSSLLNEALTKAAVVDVLKQRISGLELEIGSLRYGSRMEAAITELFNVQAAMDAAIADLSLTTVDARSACKDFSAIGACGLTGGTVPADFLYPSYLRIQIAGSRRTYSWDVSGLVTLDGLSTTYMAALDPRMDQLEEIEQRVEELGRDTRPLWEALSYRKLAAFNDDLTEQTLIEMATIDELGQRAEELETAAGLLKKALQIDTLLNDAAAIELSDIQAAMDAAIADLSLTTVNVGALCGADFTDVLKCSVGSGLDTLPNTADDLVLYPAYLRIQASGDGRTYSWDATGLVFTP